MRLNYLVLIGMLSASGCVGMNQQPAAPSESQQRYSEAQRYLDESFKRDLAESGARMAEIKTRPQKRQEVRAKYVKAHPGLPASTRKNILEGVATIGMTSDEVRASYGEAPDKINRSVYSWGVQEQWIYGDQYLYFKDGKLDSWQDSGQ